MARTIEQLEQAIASISAQRELLGDEVVETALAPLRAELAVLQGQVQPVQQLRLVSVLFLDVVGSTALSRQLDPEDIQAVMDGALSAFAVIVEQHGGRVMQYAGDSVLAAFGADEVREDDAERAVLAGLALLRQAAVEGERVQRTYGHEGFGIRVGISSGGVLIGGGVDGENSIRGITVNIAARMEQSAPPGTLRISHDTWRLVRGLFDCEEQPPLVIKGRDEPMRTHLVRGVMAATSSAARRGVEGVRSAMVGRDDQLARLQAAVQRAEDGSALVAVTIVADAGLGKTRLLDEFDRWLAARSTPPTRMAAQAAERRRGQPYGLLRLLFLAPLGVSEIDDPRDARAAWLMFAEPALGHRGSAATLGHLMGLDFSDEPEVHALRADARALRDRAFFHAAQLLAHAATAAALMVVSLDDLHWADEGSLDFVEHLKRRHAQLPLLLIELTRPSLFERRPGWAQGDGPAARIELKPLDEAARGTLSQALLRKLPSVPRSLARLVADSAEGNPFFMEELVNMLIDQGTIEVQGEGWTLNAEQLQSLQLPATLSGVLQARLDALPPDRRRALQLASVAGPVFWDQALQVLDMLAVAALGELAARELIQPHETSRLQGAQEYEFRHHTLQRVAYEAVLKRVKRAAHSTLARWLDVQPGRESLHDQIAEHYQRGGDAVLARQAWQRAAESARMRFANADALLHADRALALTEEADLETRLALHLTMIRVLESTRDKERTQSTLQAFQQLAEQHGGAGWRSEAASRLARNLYNNGQALQALEAARLGVALAAGGDSEREVRALTTMVSAVNRLGRHDEARDFATTALARARAGGLRQLEAVVLNELGSIAHGRGDMVAAESHWRHALALHREEGHLVNEGGTRSNLAFLAMSSGDFETAVAEFEQARALCERVGQMQNAGIIEINLGIVLLQLGRPDDALRHATHALDLVRATTDRWAEAAALRVLGQAEFACGSAGKARERFVASRDLFDQLGMAHLAMEAMACLCDEALARGAAAEALGHARAIIARRAGGASLDGADEPMHIPLAVWQALDAAGDPQAAAALAEAHAELLERAAGLADEAQRQRFLRAVSHHRAILAAAIPGS